MSLQVLLLHLDLLVEAILALAKLGAADLLLETLAVVFQALGFRALAASSVQHYFFVLDNLVLGSEGVLVNLEGLLDDQFADKVEAAVVEALVALAARQAVFLALETLAI